LGEDNPPNANLELEFVYGIRCHDTRNNLKFAQQNNKIVYHAAGVGIVYDYVKKDLRVHVLTQ
jgi:microtubule-associated protein-like 6